MIARRTAGRALIAAAGLVAAGLTAAGCSGRAPERQPAELVAAPGERFTLRLDANRTTGFQWELAKPLDAAVVAVVGTEYEELAGGTVGAGGTEVWTFEAVAPGWAAINLAYRRSWEEMTPARILVYSVEVVP